jgi:membrane protein implicated in regulation of membrane protease activity
MAFTWWMWLIAGGALLVLEIVTPGGFYFLFFGIGAIIVGVLSGLGLAGPAWMEWLLFAILSIVALAFFRRPLLQKLKTPDHEVDSMVGEHAVALATIAVAGMGKVELRGSVWNARNIGDSVIAIGQRCVVERIDGLVLHLRG